MYVATSMSVKGSSCGLMSLIWGWLKAGASAFRFDVMEEKEGTQGQTVLEVLTEFCEAGFITGSYV